MQKSNIIQFAVFISIVLIVGAFALTSLRQPESSEATFPTLHQGSIDAHIDIAGEFYLWFTLYSNYNVTLYYNDGFRLYRQEDEAWAQVYNQQGEYVHHVEPDTAKQNAVRWLRDNTIQLGNGMPPGQYRLARDFYLTPDVYDVHTTLYINFEIEPVFWWMNPPQTPVEPGGVSPQREIYVASVLAGELSQTIVLVGEVQVSRTAIAFYFYNRADKDYMYGRHWELAHYIDGGWQPVPHTPSYFHRALPSDAESIAGGDTKFEFHFFDFFFGELTPGRYMFIRSHWQSGRHRDREYMLIEFMIDEDTPQYLDIGHIG